MVLNVSWKFPRAGQAPLIPTLLLLGALGCAGGPDPAQVSRAQYKPVDGADQAGLIPLASTDAQTVRSQSPGSPYGQNAAGSPYGQNAPNYSLPTSVVPAPTVAAPSIIVPAPTYIAPAPAGPPAAPAITSSSGALPAPVYVAPAPAFVAPAATAPAAPALAARTATQPQGDPTIAATIVAPPDVGPGSANPPSAAAIAPPSSHKPADDIVPIAAVISTERTKESPMYQVRIVATIGTLPIYEREVREAVYQRLPEFMGLSAHERREKEQTMFKQELRRLIERELILDELFATLNNHKQDSAVKQLKEGARKEADQRLREIQKRAGLKSEDDMKMFLQLQGLTLAGLRRHFERSFMVNIFMHERFKPKIEGIGLREIKEYYADHPDEFQLEDSVKWQDIFVRVDQFRTPAEAKAHAQAVLTRARAGEDFASLSDQFNMGDSKSRGGMGFGEEKGKIFPADLEPTVFALKQGDVSLVEFESGYHIVRIAERKYAGKKPFDEQVQGEIRRKLQFLTQDREIKVLIDTLWRRSQPEILID
jgi:peptidyl-prolyl cis-trans isomerase SurA